MDENICSKRVGEKDLEMQAEVLSEVGVLIDNRGNRYAGLYFIDCQDWSILDDTTWKHLERCPDCRESLRDKVAQNVPGFTRRELASLVGLQAYRIEVGE
tara:strand:+ start:1981 stop:2280 length:300 start_codon:yes stop_codon:yes gene_type:complete